MSILIDLRTTLLERISALCAPTGVTDVDTLSGAMTPAVLQELSTHLPATRLALVSVRQNPAAYFDAGNFQTRWTAYLVLENTPAGNAKATALIEALLDELPQISTTQQGLPAQLDTLMARNLYSSTLNTAAVLLWAVSFTVAVRLGPDPFPVQGDNYEF